MRKKPANPPVSRSKASQIVSTTGSECYSKDKPRGMPNKSLESARWEVKPKVDTSFEGHRIPQTVKNSKNIQDKNLAISQNNKPKPVQKIFRGQRKSSDRNMKRNVNQTLQQSLEESENNEMYIANYEDKINASADLADFENSN